MTVIPSVPWVSITSHLRGLPYPVQECSGSQIHQSMPRSMLASIARFPLTSQGEITSHATPLPPPKGYLQQHTSTSSTLPKLGLHRYARLVQIDSPFAGPRILEDYRILKKLGFFHIVIGRETITVCGFFSTHCRSHQRVCFSAAMLNLSITL
jgi:hypothetical protein